MSAKVTILNKLQEVSANSSNLEDLAASRLGSNMFLAGILAVYLPVVVGIFGICTAEAIIDKVKGN